ncbi:hypothetical protein [Parapedobacter indicus]|uniref:Uncharacterized protein n=1 Tax=Parapedobacter indicus TaxID=1477437 RepID=A0A1I3E3Z1_9SPHI|nr:hypothetical protein [Parapedobacter indicus]PPL04959.1 hypothetical protein CLV26_101770 [Parapedobacter indicus]SFH93707.1 hypothetical protein SAMN05444682_101756 [Parapedobacter indicus]
MNLGFMQKWPKHMGEWAGQPTYFPHKIWEHLFNVVEFKDYVACTTDHLLRFGNHWDMPVDSVAPKLHTMREDPFNRWQAGNLIHFAINNQTKNYFRFAPVILCVSVQYVQIIHDSDGRSVHIGNRPDYEDCVPFYLDNGFSDDEEMYGMKEMEVFAQNDGFESIEHFFTWFNKSAKYKLIHWTTNLKY